jgi:BatD DUF11 like domain
MNRANLHIFFTFLVFLVSIFAYGQEEEVKIEFNKKNILLEENLTINVSIKNSEKWNVNTFPTIQGFTKGAKQIAHSKNSVGGQKVLTHIITQSYTPSKEGTFKIAPFILTINSKDYSSEATTIIVTAPKEEVESPVIETISPENLKNEAFLAMNVDKSKVYVGEGFRVFLAFYLAENHTSEIAFPDDLNAQVDAISKKIKSPNCLEERTTIINLNGTPTSINGKKYLAYKFFEALYFPLNNNPINIPSVDFKMTQINKKNNQKESLLFTDKTFTVNVLDLPLHPLKDKVTAGNFSLVEHLETRKINTGKSFNYVFKIIGEGNFSTINIAPPTDDSFFDFYPPDVRENHANGQASKEKEFRYRIIPKDSGQYQLDKYFYWVFFNTKTAQYDTLKSGTKIKVLGKTIADKNTGASEDIFAGIDKLDTSIAETNYQEVIKNISNLLIICMLMGSLYLFNWGKRKGNEL